MNEQALWPDETDHSEQTRERERLQEDIQEAWRKVEHDWFFCSVKYNIADNADIKLLKWALGVK